jgi:hypothetical protein
METLVYLLAPRARGQGLFQKPKEEGRQISEKDCEGFKERVLRLTHEEL